MCFGHIVDELHDEHSLAHAGTAKETNLTTTLVGSQKIHHLTIQRLPVSCHDIKMTSTQREVIQVDLSLAKVCRH
jgi:hypothetical protein